MNVWYCDSSGSEACLKFLGVLEALTGQQLIINRSFYSNIVQDLKTKTKTTLIKIQS